MIFFGPRRAKDNPAKHPRQDDQMVTDVLKEQEQLKAEELRLAEENRLRQEANRLEAEKKLREEENLAKQQHEIQLGISKENEQENGPASMSEG